MKEHFALCANISTNINIKKFPIFFNPLVKKIEIKNLNSENWENFRTVTSKFQDFQDIFKISGQSVEMANPEKSLKLITYF